MVTSDLDSDFDIFTADGYQWPGRIDNGDHVNVHSDEHQSDSDCSTSSGHTSSVTENIEEMVISFLSQLARPGCRQRSENSEIDDASTNAGNGRKLSSKDYTIDLQLVDRKKRDANGSVTMKTLRYPRKCKMGSLKPFAQLFKVLDIVHESTLSGIATTKRDIYYRDVPLFKSQKVVDTLVDDIAATFELDRSDLNIRSSSKGLLCGSGITINLLCQDVIRCSDSEGTLIPAGEDIESFTVDDDIAWVLIVEKEAVFQTLCQLKLTKLESMPGRGLIITGKGYPDVATRHLVKSLADALPRSIPILGLVDGDPYGLDILAVYKYGSNGMRHENEKLAAKRVRWLGLWASELASFGINRDFLLPITIHDEKKALTMLRRQSNPLPAKWRKELQYMLHNRRKAEIEVLLTSAKSDTGGHLDDCALSSANCTQSNGKECPAPHGLFLHYLMSKITYFVQSARDKSLQKEMLSNAMLH